MKEILTLEALVNFLKQIYGSQAYVKIKLFSTFR